VAGDELKSKAELQRQCETHAPDAAALSFYRQREHKLFAGGRVMLLSWSLEYPYPVLTVTESVRDLLGYSPDELLHGPMDFMELIHPEDRIRSDAEILRAQAERPQRYAHKPYRVRHKDGRWVWVLDNTAEVVTLDGPVAVGCLIALDDRCDLQGPPGSEADQAHQSGESADADEPAPTGESIETGPSAGPTEADATAPAATGTVQARPGELDAIGQLAGGIAHRFNNALTVILGNAHLLAGEIVHAEHRRWLDDIVQAGRRAAGDCSHLIAFAQKSLLRMQAVNLNVLIGRVAGTLAEGPGPWNEITVASEAGSDVIWADPDRLAEMLVSLARGARQTLSGSNGELIIATADAPDSDAGDPLCPLPPDLAGGGTAYVRISVSDTGVRLDQLACLHMFEPFYTPAGSGDGPGLGLASVYGLARQQRGTVQVGAGENGHLRFDLYLPTEPPREAD
jgi:PAS domain S-box-containing protein